MIAYNTFWVQVNLLVWRIRVISSVQPSGTSMVTGNDTFLFVDPLGLPLL
jgi:hypothetical protein